MKMLLKILLKIVWILAVAQMIYGIVIMIQSVPSAKNIMQQIFIDEDGIASVIIPYCIARAVSFIFRKD